MDLYAENILDHYHSPRRKKPLAHPTIEHEEDNPACGDSVHIQLQIDGETITNIGWSGTGCAISQAAMSMLSEEILGKSVENTDALTKDSVLTLLGVPIGPRRLKCALLGLHTCKNAIQKARGSAPRGWTESVLCTGALYWSR